MIGLCLDSIQRSESLARKLSDMGCDVSITTPDASLRVDLLVFDSLSFGKLDITLSRRLPPCIVIDGQNDAAAGIAAVRQGALDYLISQTSDVEVIGGVFEWHKRCSGGGVQTLSPASERLFEQARRVAATDVAVLLSGESGTGKEVLARFIHSSSARQTSAFVTVNCAAIPDNMLEAMLFGHEKGAFTGATESRPGKFELADRGTLLLDEITEMPLALQAKLLRVLQEREVERIGARAPRCVDVRVIATTNRNLQAAVKSGQLREDLYFRLSVFPLALPPLRNRPEEIPGLVNHFLHKHRRLVAPRLVRGVTSAVLETFSRYDWPGNVRELENVIQRALVLCDDDQIDRVHIDLGMTRLDSQTGELAQSLLLAEGETIIAALRAHAGHRVHTAEALGISERTLRYKLRRLKDLGMDVT
jgi:two-component system, response regulator FlrC